MALGAACSGCRICPSVVNGCTERRPARPRERGPKPERGAGSAGAAERSEAALTTGQCRHERSFGNWEGSMSENRGPEVIDRLPTVEEAADWLRISRWSVYNLIRNDQLRTLRIGRRRLVTRSALEDCVRQLSREAA